MSNKLTTLNALERSTLRVCEAKIEKHVGAFLEVGNALATINDQRLYRETHKTFERYIKDRWDFSRDYAYKMIAAAEVVENVDHGIQKPTSERVARPLVVLPPEKQPEAWAAAVAKAEENGKPVTAAIVEEVVAEFSQPEEREPGDDTPDVAASVLQAMNTDKIKPTPAQLEKLAELPEKAQNRIVKEVKAGSKSLGVAIKEANGRQQKEASPADQAKAQVKIWADTVSRWLGQSPSIDEYRAAFPGPKGDAVVTAATALYEALKVWHKAIR